MLQYIFEDGGIMEQTGFLNMDFQTCLAHLMQHGMVSNPRGSETKELLNYNITLLNPRNRVITFKARKTNTRYLLGEFIWYLSGSNDPEGILPYSKFWNNIRNSGEMKEYPAGTVNSNYGERIFGHHNKTLVPRLEYHMTPAGYNEKGQLVIEPHETPVVYGDSQWDSTIALLKQDKDTRQAVMNIHIPEDRHKGNKDVACTLTLQFFIREEALHMIVNMRSNDIIRGFTNDVFQFTMLQECMMLQLRDTYPDLKLGHYFHNAGSIHIYELHYEMADQILKEDAIDLEMIPMDRFDKEICSHLLCIEQEWREAGMPEDFNFEPIWEWTQLTPYWQTVVNALFLKDEAALHQLFAHPEAEDAE